MINHSGVVSKAPSFGIRVEERRYQSAFAELRSGSAFKPNLVGTPKHFLLQGPPRNLDRDTSAAISARIKWDFRMLKKRPNGDMVIGTECDPHPSTIMVNQKKVLITKIEQIQKSAPAVVAGRLPSWDSERKMGNQVHPLLPPQRGPCQSQRKSILQLSLYAMTRC